MIIAIVVTAALLTGDENSDATEQEPVQTTVSVSTTINEPTASTIPAVVQEFVDLRRSGQAVASLQLATSDIADRERDFFGGLEAWNLQGEQIGSCDELSQGRFQCALLEFNDVHAAGGLSPWEARLTFTVNDADQIDSLEFSVIDCQTTIEPFNRAFLSWIGWPIQKKAPLWLEFLWRLRSTPRGQSSPCNTSMSTNWIGFTRSNSRSLL